MKAYQSGSTLIVVLGLLVVITLIGTLAMKNSLVSLNIATNSQVQQIMTQSSDSALFQIEDPTQLGLYLASDGLLGYMKTDANKEKELVFCVRGSDTQFFDMNKASIIHWQSGKPGPTNNLMGFDGYCDMTTNDSYTSGRKAVMTQIAVRYTSTPTDPFQFYHRGTDPSTAKLEPAQRLMVHSTSLMPTLTADLDVNKVNDCLKKHLNLAIEPIDSIYDENNTDQVKENAQGKISVSQCLTSLNVPHTTQVVEYKEGPKVTKQL